MSLSPPKIQFKVPVKANS